MLQVFLLPSDGFFAGDQGTKLLQTVAATRHGPLSPWIEGPSDDVDPDFEHREPFLIRRHGDRRLVGVFPWIFPAVTAPFFSLLGLRGLYVVPALSVAVTFLAARRLGQSLGVPSSGAWSGAMAVAATPVLFYGAEFWEHAPGVALTTTAVVLAAPFATHRTARDAAAGLCLGLAATFRPEGLVMLPAIVAARAATNGWRRAARSALALACGWGAAVALMLPANHAVYGTFIPQHLSSNLAFGAERYWSQRVEIVKMLFLPVWFRRVFVITAIAGLALAFLRRASPARVWMAHVVVGVLVTIGLGVPLWRYAMLGASRVVAFGVASVAHTWLFAFALVYLPFLPGSDAESVQRRYLVICAVGSLAGAMLVMPHAGGAQWGARFLLPAAPLLAVLASSVPPRRMVLAPTVPLGTVRVAGIAVLCLSVAVQAYGVKWLGDVKAMNAALVDATEAATQDGEIVVSDLYWFPELCSRLYSSRRFLFAWSHDDLDAIARRAADFGHTHLVVVTSTPVTHWVPPATLGSLGHTPLFRQASTRDLGARALVLHRYTR